MAEFHVKLKETASGHGLANVDSPGVSPVISSAGKAVTSTKNTSGQITDIHGTQSGVILDNPA